MVINSLIIQWCVVSVAYATNTTKTLPCSYTSKYVMEDIAVTNAQSNTMTDIISKSLSSIVVYHKCGSGRPNAIHNIITIGY